jgi:hypothetical protein
MARLESITAAAAIAVIAAAALSSATPARAAHVWLWACHGPGGEPLAATPFQPVEGGDELAYGDGLAQEDDGGCASGAGGLSATFSRPDPEGGSEALWQLKVPEGVALESVRIARMLSGFGGEPIAGDPLWYETQTSSSERIESASLESGDPPLAGVLEAPAKGRYVRVSVGCGLAAAKRCAAPANGETVGVRISAIALGVRDGAPPSAPSVGGVESPVAGTLSMALSASDTGVGLASAEASLASASTFVRLGRGACPEHPSAGATINLPLGATGCKKEVSAIPLPLDVADVPDGEHTLLVRVTDAAGNTTTREWPIVVRNSTPPPSASASATIAIAGGGSAPSAPPSPPPGAHGGVSGFSSSTPGGTPVACELPMLSMRLVSKPLRWARIGGRRARGRRVPVLLARRHYVFRGHLTCLVHNRRVSAPSGIVLRVLYRLKTGRHRHRTYASGRGTMTVHNGNLRAILGYWSSRTIIFRYRPGDGEFAQVTIPVKVVHHRSRVGRRHGR